MTNVRFDTIGQYEDIETLGAYKTCREILGMSEEETMAAIHARSRDNARTPMQWDDSANGGFTAGTPWFAVNPNYTQINAASQVGADGSVYEDVYKRQGMRRRRATSWFSGWWETASSCFAPATWSIGSRRRI